MFKPRGSCAFQLHLILRNESFWPYSSTDTKFQDVKDAYPFPLSYRVLRYSCSSQVVSTVRCGRVYTWWNGIQSGNAPRWQVPAAVMMGLKTRNCVQLMCTLLSLTLHWVTHWNPQLPSLLHLRYYKTALLQSVNSTPSGTTSFPSACTPKQVSNVTNIPHFILFSFGPNRSSTNLQNILKLYYSN
jgi:hypothetical protein